MAGHDDEGVIHCAVKSRLYNGLCGRQIMAVPFSHLDEWEMNATTFQGCIFIEENHGKKLDSREDQWSQQNKAGAPSQNMMSYWGYKFETLCLLPELWHPTSREYIETRDSQVVSNQAQYCSVVRTGYGKIKMVIGGEVDAGKFCLGDTIRYS
jgi:RAT1-interacting protein